MRSEQVPRARSCRELPIDTLAASVTSRLLLLLLGAGDRCHLIAACCRERFDRELLSRSLILSLLRLHLFCEEIAA